MCTSTRVLPYKATKQIQLAIPQYPLLYSSLFQILLWLHMDHFYTSCFLFKIDLDDGTVTGILNHLNTIRESYINRYLIYRHRVDCCINYVLVFQLFAIVFLLSHTCNCIRISKISIFYKHVHRKVPYCHKNTTRILRFIPISSKEGNEPTPVL